MNIKPYLREVSLKRDLISSFDAYPFCLPAVRELYGLEFHPDVTFIVGENGSGKSTVLEAIATAWGFNPEGGTLNFRFSTRESHSDLYSHIRLVKSFRRPTDGFFLRAESFFNVATNIESPGLPSLQSIERDREAAFPTLAANKRSRISSMSSYKPSTPNDNQEN